MTFTPAGAAHVPTRRVADCEYCDRYDSACGRHEPPRVRADAHAAHVGPRSPRGISTGPDAGNVTRAISFTAGSNGITMTVSRTYGAGRKLSSSDEMLSFEDATELHRALGELLNDSAIREGDTVNWTPDQGSELTAVVASVHGENAYVTDIETGLTTYVGVSQLRRT